MPVPDVICSVGTAWSETVRLGSAPGSGFCHAGITDVASSKACACDGVPLVDGGLVDGHATIVDLTSSIP
jgi:hypothetical protein